MSLQRRSVVRDAHPVLREAALVTALLVAVYLWRRMVGVVTGPLSSSLDTTSSFGVVPVGGFVAGLLFVAGLATFAGAYATARDVDVGLSIPSSVDLPSVGLAALAPVALVGLTKFVGLLTGVPYGRLTQSYYGVDPTTFPVLVVVGLGLVVGVPGLVIACQVLVQGSFGRALDGDEAVLLTTLVTWFALTSTTGRLTPAPDPGKLIGAVAFVLFFGVFLFARDRAEGAWPRALAAVPVLLFVGVVVLSGVVGTTSYAAGLFGFTHLAVLGVAAYTYDRSGSLLVPAVAYLGLSLANHGVVVLFESGAGPW